MVGCTYGSLGNAPFHHLFRGRVDGDLAAAVDHAVADDGLGVDWEWGRGFVCVDCRSGGHFAVRFETWVGKGIAVYSATGRR